MADKRINSLFPEIAGGVNTLVAQRSWLENIFSPWVETLDRPVYLTLGNHDFVDDFKGSPNLCYGTARVANNVLIFRGLHNSPTGQVTGPGRALKIC